MTVVEACGFATVDVCVTVDVALKMVSEPRWTPIMYALPYKSRLLSKGTASSWSWSFSWKWNR